jgi:hypothetical protein
MYLCHMKHTTEKMNHKLTFLDDNKKAIVTNGYAFIDEFGCCIIIVYGEGRRDAMSKYLTEDGDVLKIKYKVIDIKHGKK